MTNPRRPHPYQITDSVFTQAGDRVIETWWRIDRRGNSEDAEAVHGPFVDAAMAAAFVAQRNG